MILDPPEHLTETGAQMLALRIACYWADRGVKIATRIEPIKPPRSFEGHLIFCVRSDLRIAAMRPMADAA